MNNKEQNLQSRITKLRQQISSTAAPKQQLSGKISQLILLPIELLASTIVAYIIVHQFKLTNISAAIIYLISLTSGLYIAIKQIYIAQQNNLNKKD
jgi:hypothetical protein